MKRIPRNLFSIAFSAGIMSFTSCKENKESTTDATQEDVEMTQDDNAKTIAQNAEFDDEKVASEYVAYLQLKDALVATDANAAKKAAKKMTGFENAEIAELATKISEETAIEAQRKVFSELTVLMEPVLENAIASGEIYKQFCPMAFDGKGASWFAASEEINNPYFGDKMLHCGRVEKTIQ
ncbi:DUF3347 domain-containing protein [Zunongwangia sp. HGR-M22]|uniref:DUF3347 domain-containing protein n=1 Tax=Zunongwangia sp. HGR-M22 TaxID=3015168 RepID=UPI0022DD16ED|nr:DUF3347 domain-containing protein [Zunongwangia sp. HGR-M22]WBL26110.1 DUF3347 domain-containing protein [Zunongwangia sp. HGR-M22]